MAHRGEAHRSSGEARPGGSTSTGASSGSGRPKKRRRGGSSGPAGEEAQQLQALQHLESFYEKLPPGLVKEAASKPEDCIPDAPGNEHARQFLARAPTRGLWMPLGQEVKVMQCWRCKRYGHRTGDKECPFFTRGNQRLEQFRVAHEDPMYDLIRQDRRHEKERRIQQLQRLLEDDEDDDDEEGDDSESSSSSSSSSSTSSGDPGKRKRKRKKKKDKKKRKKKKRKHKAPKAEKKAD